MEQNKKNKLNLNGLTKSTNEIPEMLEVYSANDAHEKLLMNRFNPHKTEKIDIFTQLGKET